MIIEKLIQRVQSIYSAGLQSADTRLTSEHIYNALQTARSVLLRQRADKGQKINQWNYQVLPCVELTPVPVHECPCVPSAGCMVLRTKHRLPRPISGLSSHLIKSFTSLDGAISFDETSFESNRYKRGNKFTSKKPDYYVRDGYLYITVIKALKGATITGIFEDIIEANNFPSICECAECDDCTDVLQIDFPIDGDLVKPLLEIAQAELIELMKQMVEDKENNGADDTGLAGAMVHRSQNQ